MPNSISGFADFAEELRDFRDDIGEAKDNLPRGVDLATKWTAESVFSDSQRDVPVDTGELKNSGHVYQRRGGEWVVEYRADHARPVEEGADPHVIEAKDADALRFTSNGEVFYRVRVRHPGQAAQPYLKPAVDNHRFALAENIAVEVQRTFERAFR